MNRNFIFVSLLVLFSRSILFYINFIIELLPLDHVLRLLLKQSYSMQYFRLILLLLEKMTLLLLMQNLMQKLPLVLKSWLNLQIAIPETYKKKNSINLRDVYKYTKCPVLPGTEITAKVPVLVPVTLPKTNYNFKVSIVNLSNNDIIGCSCVCW